MFFERRKELRELAAAEAEGRSFWTSDLSEPVRTKLMMAVRDFALGMDPSRGGGFSILAFARKRVLADRGSWSLAGNQSSWETDVGDLLMKGDVDGALSYVEAVLQSPQMPQLVEMMNFGTIPDQLRWERQPALEKRIKTILREHRVSFDLVDLKFVPLESQRLHEAVLVPALTLLSGRRGSEKIEAAYKAALDEVYSGKNGKADSAITIAGTALQEALELAGCSGNALGPLIGSAVKKGLIEPHDKNLLHWVSADRSNKGNAHNADGASIEDAWLAIHVVGAIILRLFGGVPRNSPS